MAHPTLPTHFPATSHLYSQTTQPAYTQSLAESPSASQLAPRAHQQPAKWGYLFSLRDGEIHSLTAASTSIGRSEHAGIQIADEKISGTHAIITRELVAANPFPLQGSGAGASPPLAPLDHNHSFFPNALRYVTFIEDRSMNGTYVDGNRMKKGSKQQLEDGQEVSFVAIAAKRSRATGAADTSQPSGTTTNITSKITTYVRTFDFHLVREQPRAPRYSSALSEASTQPMATPGSMIFPAEPPTNSNGGVDSASFPFGGLGPSAAVLARVPSAPKVLSWQWGECVGHGTFAEVYIGLDLDTGKMIAIKRMKASLDGTTDNYPSHDNPMNAYSDTLDDWGVDPDDMFDPDKASQSHRDNGNGSSAAGNGKSALGGASTDTLDDNTRQISTSDSISSPRVVPTPSGVSPTDPNASTLPMVSKAVLKRDHSTREEFQGLSSEQHAEVELLKSLTHPSVVHYYGFAIEDGHLCILLEFVAGGSLMALLKKFGAFQETVVRIYTTQALQGLEYLHSNGVVHGDIKPANFLVTDRGKVKMSDFGTGRIVSSAVRSASNSNQSSMVNRGRCESAAPASLTGTPAYMSPDHVRSNKSTFASDIWALGCTVLELFTGTAPWAELQLNNPIQLVYQIGMRESAPSIDRVVGKGGSEAFIDFLRRCFTVNPDDRPTATDLLTHPWITQEANEDVGSWVPPSILAGQRHMPPTLQQYLQHSGSVTPAGGNTPHRLSGAYGKAINDGHGLFGAAMGSSPRGLLGENSNNAVSVPAHHHHHHLNVSVTSQQSQQHQASQQAEAGEAINQHQHFLQTRAKTMLKKMPSTAGTPNSMVSRNNASAAVGGDGTAGMVVGGGRASSAPFIHPRAGTSFGLGGNVVISVPFPSNPTGASATAADTPNEPETAAAVANTRAGRAEDQQRAAEGLHTGLTEKMRRVELHPKPRE